MNASKLLATAMALDLEPIVYSLVKKDDGPRWSMKKAQSAVLWYRRFLFLTCLHPERLVVPTKEIDEVWHAHILDTKKYFDDCHNLCGKFIHHFPYLGLRGRQDEEQLNEAFFESLAMYEKYFNAIPVDVSSQYSSALCSSCSACGSYISPSRAKVANLTERPTIQ
ncbi:MAG: glycine-rich domain-containing protein-like [Rhodocyclaceae bacterium]|nr:glycine-rich domain-containing protein-like [Rhodocyclaceae bacterium]